MVKTLPSNARGSGSIPGRGAKIPHPSGPKNQNIKQKQYVANSIKTLKMVHVKKKSLKKRKKEVNKIISDSHKHYEEKKTRKRNRV